MLEFVPGGDLGTCVLEHGQLEPARVAKYLKQLFSAVAHFHEFGIIHRGKTANHTHTVILIT